MKWHCDSFRAQGTHEASHGLVSLESLSFGGKGIYNVIIHVYTYNVKKIGVDCLSHLTDPSAVKDGV